MGMPALSGINPFCLLPKLQRTLLLHHLLYPLAVHPPSFPPTVIRRIP